MWGGREGEGEELQKRGGVQTTAHQSYLMLKP